MTHDITRRDFVNGTLAGLGAALLGAPAPARARDAAPKHDAWTGPGGVGDYAASNGNTKTVLDAAHRIRDGLYDKPVRSTDTGERYDLVIVGGGITGLTAAYVYAQHTGGSRRCLVLENHPIFGGEAKQNEFIVNGVRLIAPQGSNDFGVPRAGSGWADEVWTDLRMPREFRFAEWDSSRAPLRMAQDNYQPMEGIGEYGTDIGYFIDGRWYRNIWQNDLADAPFSDEAKSDLLRWRKTNPDMRGMSTEEFARYLDTMTYRDYIEKVLGYRPEVTRMIEPVIGLINGASPDAVSAHAAQQIGMPGVSRVRGGTGAGLSFPGGNVTYTRHLVKAMLPDAISGEFSFEGVLTGTVNWSALDRPGQATRIRLGTTVARIQHTGDGVDVVYAKGGRLYRTHAKRVAMATGGWVNKHVMADLPIEIGRAYSEFVYAPALIVNVALTNWRFMYDLGITAARWFDRESLGFVANIRRQMAMSGYRAPTDPDKPTVLTYYVGLYTPGKSALEQGVENRNTLLNTPYAQYERAVLDQLTRQFGDHGFNAKRDVAGIILNRWGHARLVQPVGWFYGQDGSPAPREVVSRGYGQIAIGHSELNGHQNATGAMAQGRRLAEWAAG